MTISKSVRAASLAASLVALAGGAARAADDLTPAIEQVGAPPARAPGPWQISLGLRSALFRSAGYDPFSTDDVFVQPSVMATWALRTGPRLSTALGASWESGSEGAEARGAETNLSLGRVGAVIEERFAPLPWVYAFARVSPGWLRGTATLSDLAIAAPTMRTTFSTVSVDASLGAAVRMTPAKTRVGLWLMGDAGYGWAPDQHIALTPALPASDRDKAGVTTLADLAPRGVFYRFALALSF
jgi:hypothetical protein